MSCGLRDPRRRRGAGLTRERQRVCKPTALGFTVMSTHDLSTNLDVWVQGPGGRVRVLMTVKLPRKGSR